MPIYLIYARRMRDDGSWPDWRDLSDAEVNAPTETKALVKGWEAVRAAFGTHLAPHQWQLRAEKSAQQRTQTQFPPLKNKAPVHTMLWRKKVKRTNKPGTCLYCGKKLVRKHEEALGAYADNSFCSQICGYIFGISCAVNGCRLVPTVDDRWKEE